MQKIKFKIQGMHCSSCAMDIDGELEDTTGVKESNTSYAKQVCEVEFDDKQIKQGKIVELISGLGYKANPSD